MSSMLSASAPLVRSSRSNAKETLLRCAVRIHLATVLAATLANATVAAPIESQLVIDPLSSMVTVTADALGLSTSQALSDNTRQLSGTIDVVLAFGLGGDLPEEGEIGIPTAAITVLVPQHGNPLSIVLGESPFFANIEIGNLLATMSTPDPTPTMTLASDVEPTYSLDASQFSIQLPEGTIRLSAEDSIDETKNLAAFSPFVSGSAPHGTLGSVTLTELGSTGMYHQYDVQLVFAVDFKTRLIYAGSINVDIQFEGEVHASNTLFTSLAGIPGDFNEDLQVRGDDLPIWESKFGGQFQGGEMMLWQRHFGMAPPTASALSAAPEPTTALLIALASVLGARMKRSADRLRCSTSIG